jgi:hypothetical protein
MNRFKNYVLMAAGFAVLVMTVGVFTASHAIAQAVRAALVQNRDEPGRQPFTLATYPNDGFWQVPAGKRYVIESYGMECGVTSANGGALGDVALSVSGGVVSHAPAPHSIDFNGGPGEILWATSATTRLYAEPGSTIALESSANFFASHATIHFCSGYVTGYSIDLN